MCLPLFLSLALTGADAAEDLQCLKPKPGEPAASTLFYASLQQQAYAALDARLAEYEKLKTPDDIASYQQRAREFFLQQLGGFPERTPLHPQVVGKIEADGYRIEKVIFESQPHHHVTASLYLPEASGPVPCVLVSSGHSRTAKAAEYNQRIAITLARHGIAGLAYDPIGQGERSQILDEEGQPEFSGTTTEHFLVGVGSILVGRNTARYRVWDAIRAIDYVCSRPEIDKERIGFTGCSGGGTLTSYTMALDDRVVCAAPACYLTTFHKLLETIGPQDAEQNIFGQVKFGLDQPDYVLLRAPRPTLISSSTGDFFDIGGSWDNYRQAKRVFARLGYPERVDLVEAEGGHGVHPENLIAIVRWMRRWLLGKDDAVTIEPITPRSVEELHCTDKGQVLLLPGEKSVFDLNAEYEKTLAEKRREFWKKTPKAEALEAVREQIGIRPIADLPAPKMDEAGRVDRDGYHIDKFVLHTGSGVPLPGLTYHPARPVDDAYLYLHADGKAADGAPGGPIEKLVQAGNVVVAIDLRGTGETAGGKPDALLGQWKSYYLAYLLGQSLVGLHTEDTLAAGHFVANYKTKTPRKVHLIAVGSACIPALHSAALLPDQFASVTLRDYPDSWSTIVGHSVPAGRLTTAVHGALATYDLTDLRDSLGNRVRIEK
ncbi:MAG TPA: acetylxylan esterase [Pirellulaceae bacterium]|nr:acetylxylan esterase [Pirellulaceae bacterium]